MRLFVFLIILICSKVPKNGISTLKPSMQLVKNEICMLNVLEFAELKPFALVKITALMEEYCQTCQKTGWNRLRSVPKFIKRHQRSIHENDIKNKNVFGVPFKINIQRHGMPLPQSIIEIMDYIRQNSTFTVGIFRKGGAKSRMNAIREEIEKYSRYNFEGDQSKISSPEYQAKISNDVIDAADIFKQYLRELPECLLTNKLSQTLIDIFTCKFKNLCRLSKV